MQAVTLLNAEGQGEKILPNPVAIIPDASCLQGSPASFLSFGHPNTQTLISILELPLRIWHPFR